MAEVDPRHLDAGVTHDKQPLLVDPGVAIFHTVS